MDYTPQLTYEGEDGFKITITDDLGSQYIQDVNIVIEDKIIPEYLKVIYMAVEMKTKSSKES